MSEYHRESQLLRLLVYLREHPGMVLSISYVLLTLCGILYSVSFYNQFDLDILKLADVSDLLITGLSEPAALLMFTGAMIVAIFVDLVFGFTHKIQSEWLKKPKSIKRGIVLALAYTPKKSEHVMLMIVGIFILYSYIFVSSFAEKHSQQVKRGLGDKVLVNSETLGIKDKSMTLLGSTARYLLLYNHIDSEVTVAPIENIGMLSVESSAPEN